MKSPERRQPDKTWPRQAAIISSFGIGLIARIYILGFLLGGWLDKRFFDGGNWCFIVLVLAAIGLSLYRLFRDVMRVEKDESGSKPSNGGQ